MQTEQTILQPDEMSQPKPKQAKLTDFINGPIPLSAWTRKTPNEIKAESRRFTIIWMSREVSEFIDANRAERDARKRGDYGGGGGC